MFHVQVDGVGEGDRFCRSATLFPTRARDRMVEPSCGICVCICVFEFVSCVSMGGGGWVSVSSGGRDGQFGAQGGGRLW